MAVVFKDLETHVEEALGNLLEQFQDSAQLKKLLEIYIRQISDLENAFEQLQTERTDIATSVGAQLDGIGSIIGEARQGRDDADYRIALNNRIALNLSTGTREDIITVMLGVLGQSTNVQITEYFPAAFEALIEDAVMIGFDPTQVQTFVSSARPAGVRGIVRFENAGAFRFDVGPGYDVGLYAGAVDA